MPPSSPLAQLALVWIAVAAVAYATRLLFNRYEREHGQPFQWSEIPRRVAASILALVIFSVVAVCAWPTMKYTLDDHCRPEGVTAQARSAVFGPLFWDKQRQALDNELQWQADTPKRLAEMKATLADGQRALVEIQQQLPADVRVTPPPESEANRLRRKADELDEMELQTTLEQFRQQRVQELLRCRQAIANRSR